MLPSHRSGPKRSISLAPTTGIAVRTFCISLVALVSLFFLVPAPAAHASSGGSLQLGTVTVSDTLMVACGGGQWLPNMQCHVAKVTGCNAVDDLGFMYGELIPQGKVNGVIVFFDGGDGITPAGETDEFDMLTYYASQNYAVVQIAWSTAWEQTSSPNIQNAACRPATFLNFVYSGIYQYIATGTGGNPNAGMCAHGFSAGSAAIAYSMAYYGAGSYLDNVELISGPVLSDIKQGCQVPPVQTPVTVCAPQLNGQPQYGCRLGGDSPWALPPAYAHNDTNYLRAWTNDSTCNGSATTSLNSNAAWLAESIVDLGTGAAPLFSYPNTAMAGWLCTPQLQNLATDCATNPLDVLHCPNNSSPQGQLFYVNITGTNSTPVYNVYSVDGCYGPEGAPLGTISAIIETINGVPQPLSGQIAIEQDMAGGNYLPAQCFRRPH